MREIDVYRLAFRERLEGSKHIIDGKIIEVCCLHSGIHLLYNTLHGRVRSVILSQPIQNKIFSTVNL